MLVKNKTYIIAEIGINHNGSVDKAKQLIDKACESGVDAVKLQTYITEKRAEKNSPIFKILKDCELPLEAFRELKDHAAQYDVDFFSTPFDNDSVDCLKDLGINLYKIASFDVANLKFIDYISRSAKEVIMSTGMANIEEIKGAVDVLEGRCDVSLLHCVSSYPTKPQDANLSAIQTLINNFSCPVGYSDHALGIDMAVYSVLLGASIIEKHFKINEDCADAKVSLAPEEMKLMVDKIRDIPKILGEGSCGISKAQEASLFLRKFSQ